MTTANAPGSRCAHGEDVRSPKQSHLFELLLDMLEDCCEYKLHGLFVKAHTACLLSIRLDVHEGFEAVECMLKLLLVGRVVVNILQFGALLCHVHTK